MSEPIYQPPKAEPAPETPIDPGRGRAMAVGGMVLLLAPFAGVLITVLAMMSAFGTLSDTGQADPELLADEISVSLWATMVGYGLALIGAVLAGISLFGAGNRERWFRNNLLVISCLHALFFPIGTVIGVMLIVGLVMKWSEFRSAKEKEVTA